MVLLNLYDKLFNFIAAKRLINNDLDQRRIHSHTVVVLSTGILMWAHTFLAYQTISNPVPGMVGIVCSTIHLLSPLLFRVSSNALMISNIMISMGMIHQGVFSYYTGGFESKTLIWFGILPLLGGIIAGRKSAIFWFAVTTIWAATYLYLKLHGHSFPNLISSKGALIANILIVFGWIFLSSIIIYVLLVLNEGKEKLLAQQSVKIDDLFRVLFHDLAGPLSKISLGLSIAKKDSNIENKNHGLEIASNATESMLDITQNVRRMYAVSKGKIATDLKYFPLNDAINYIVKVYTPEIKKKSLQIEFNNKKYDGLKVLVEPISFKYQVLGNALSNAIKFSPPSSTIRISAYSVNDHFHCVEIADEGIGMPEDLIGSVFDIHKKTSRPGTSGELGTGLGLHIIKSFVELYQGHVRIESSNQGHHKNGTVVKFLLKALWNKEEAKASLPLYPETEG